MGRHIIETIMGAVVLLVAAFFLVFAYTQADLGTVKGYPLTAVFESVGGLSSGADVRINGIKVGTVMSQAINPTTFQAEVKMSIRPDVRLPKDSTALIDSDGLLGGKYLKLAPGRSKDLIASGGAISNTRSYRSLEEMVGDIIFLASDSGPSSGAGASAKAPPSSEGAKP